MGHDIEYIKKDDMDTENFILHPVTVMLNYAGEYCDACQAAVTVIRNSNAALKSCVEQLSGDRAYFSFFFLTVNAPTSTRRRPHFQCSFADRPDMHKPANVLSSLAMLHDD